MNETEVYAIIAHQKKELLSWAEANGEDPKLVAELRCSLAETKIKYALIKVRNYWSATIGQAFDQNLSRRLDLLQALIDEI